MERPWEIRPDFDRIPESLPTFIIFCEDEVSEPVYFKYFETSKIKINPIKNQKSKMPNVLKAITHCIKEGIINELDRTLNKEGTQVWCVFDRDRENNENEIRLGNTSFNQSIITAENNGIKVAWSNDAFELWILLHFEDIAIENPECKNRTYYYKKLTDIFKTLPYPNEDLIKALAHVNFDYKEDMKSENNFRNIVRAEIISNTTTAIRRATAFYQHYESTFPAKPSHEKAPCTLVYQLVEELMRAGGKKA